MANIIKPKRSNTAAAVPTTGQLASGELAVNMADKKVYINNGTSVVQVGAGNLSALGDANISAPSNGQSLTYDTASGKWVNTSAGTGTVTSVGMTVPTGLSVSGSPVTNSGTLAVELTAGYSIPTTASQTNWNTAYSDRLKWDGGSTGLTASTGRTSLGGSTVGQNFFTLTNPTSVTFPRINADNTVSALDATTFRTAIGAGTSSTTGTVTSVTGGSYLTGGTITSSGTLAVDATSANTASKVVARDASGDFSAGTITAALNGNAATATTAASVSASADQAIVNQNNGNSSAWYGRILSKNATSDKASFLGTYGSIAGVFSHNNALNAWADLYVNTVDGSSGGSVRMPSTTYISGNQVLHAGNYNSYSPTLTGTGASGTWGISISGNAATVTNGVYTNTSSTLSGDNYLRFGPNSSWGAYLRVGGNGRVSTTDATVATTNGNLHLDSANGSNIYLNYYAGGSVIGPGGVTMLSSGNYTSYAPSLTGSGASGTWGINISGNAATATTATTATTASSCSGNAATATNVTGVVSAGNGGTGLSAPGVTGNVLTSNGAEWVSSAPAGGFPAGTVMLFSQTSAPTGWTKDSTNYNDYALRVTTGTVSSGGTVGFTTAFASYTPAGSISINTSGLSAGATTLTTAQMPSHTHSAGSGLTGGGTLVNAGGYGQLSVGYGATSSTGGNGSHSHAMSGSATGTFTGTARDFAVKYIDIIRATKG